MAAFLFDMDGLMLDTQGLAHRALQMAGQALGLRLTRGDCEGVRGLNENETICAFEKQLNVRIDYRDFLEKFHCAYDSLLAGGIRPKEGLLELLDLLDARGFPKAVATSTQRQRAIAKLKAAGVADRFPVIVGGDEVPRGKPAPDIFLLAAHRLGVLPQDCYVVEDAEAGVRAAEAAGMRPILVPDGTESRQRCAASSAKTYRSLLEVKTHIESLPANSV